MASPFRPTKHGVPFTPSSVCYLASVSKQFTALTTLLLVDDRKLALDECIKSIIIPELPDCASDINIRHLLTHTSGLRDYFTLGYLSGLRSEHPYSEDDIIRIVSGHESLIRNSNGCPRFAIHHKISYHGLLN
jgi:CubicO group peptidase (beta-lactamase class C family)